MKPLLRSLRRALFAAAALLLSLPSFAADDNQKASSESTALACATTVYSRPGVRFMHKLRAENPNATVSVGRLPKGLTWNARRRVVEGIVRKEGHYSYQVRVSTAESSSTTDISLTVSDHLPLVTPFMGWISWNSVQGDVSDSIVRQMVRLFHDTGLYAAGWRWIVIDDLWHASSRAADGSPQPNAERFPDGLRAVSDYVHEAGMSFGIYTNEAERTCAGAYGTYGYETADAEAYARWGVDIVKCDYCHAPVEKDTAIARYRSFADALQQAGNGTRLYICEWGDRQPWTWGAEAGGVCWRVSGDVRDCWTGKDGGVGVIESIRAMKDLAPYAGVCRYNDADMLCTGLHGTGRSSNDLCGGSGPGMTQDEYATQFALWCMWSSPMSLSFDPRSRTLTADDLRLLTNRSLIALNQDPMGQQADPVQSGIADLFFLAKDCADGDVALSVTNLGDTERTATFLFALIPHLTHGVRYAVRDLLEDTSLAPAEDGQLTVRVRPHATRLFRLTRQE